MEKLVTFTTDIDLWGSMKTVAARQGMSLSEFCRNVLKKAVEESGSIVDIKKGLISKGEYFEGAPEFLLTMCKGAKLGGTDGYQFVGHEFSSHLFDLRPDLLPPDVWKDKLADLVVNATNESITSVTSWIKRYFPGCLEVIPSSRRPLFLKGVCLGVLSIN